MSNNIISELRKFVENSELSKSSHWKKFLKDADIEDIYSHLGFGSFLKNNFFKACLHSFFQRITFNNKIFFTKEYKLFKNLCLKQKRIIDVNVIRHVFTFQILNQYNLLNDSVCIIGDGKTNFLGGLILLNKNLKIYSVNLPEVLIHDHIILRKYKLVNDDNIVVVKNKNDLLLKNKNIYLIPSSNANFLLNQNIQLFVNIASFQEMTVEEIDKYFNIIKSNFSYFYSCNREYKKLIGGEELFFDKYPWGDGKKLFYENCSFHQKYYAFRPPFLRNYDGNTKHCLINYSK
tara:strand:- start:413 stop:1282 length:870 start_codon:yes stop_codon:yes gene_type:complete